jgi:hypothetical protein
MFVKDYLADVTESINEYSTSGFIPSSIPDISAVLEEIINDYMNLQIT